ncbi:hypothetical protein H0H81_007365 [Sphagnurus paluster]|uniref:SET domain-containing protein n=1 Tax=Sphagnurus paluster TaxID=117069 RepID=A0A9P7FQT0_9AGAR|nr:hypothetical protein H0H81_007365 [Sphagnurus paluster]
MKRGFLNKKKSRKASAAGDVGMPDAERGFLTHNRLRPSGAANSPENKTEVESRITARTDGDTAKADLDCPPKLQTIAAVRNAKPDGVNVNPDILSTEGSRARSSTNSKTSGTVHDSRSLDIQDFSPIPVPCTELSRPDAPRMGKLPTEDFNFHVLTLPRLNPSRQQLTLCLLYPGMREAILALPNFPDDLPSGPTWPNEPFAIRETSGCGLGVFATAPFAQGDLIVCERPLFVIPLAFPAGIGPLGDIVKIVVDQLHPALQAVFYSLYNCKNNKFRDVAGITDTNLLSIGAMAFYVHALRPIKPNEQIYMSYIDGCLTRTTRQSELLSKYSSYVCACCSLPPEESAQSDIRRTKLGIAWRLPDARDQHEPLLRKWATDMSYPDELEAVKACEEHLEYMDEEQLYPKELCLQISEVVFKVHCMLKDRERAVRVANMAALVSKVFTGSDGGWNRVAQAPERTEWWGLRQRKSTESATML